MNHLFVALLFAAATASDCALASSCAKTVNLMYATGTSDISARGSAEILSGLSTARLVSAPIGGHITVLYGAVVSNSEESTPEKRHELADLRQASLRRFFDSANTSDLTFVLTIVDAKEQERYAKQETTSFTEIVFLYSCAGT